MCQEFQAKLWEAIRLLKSLSLANGQFIFPCFRAEETKVARKARGASRGQRDLAG